MVSSAGVERVRTAELVAALSLATDLGMGFPLEHGLHGTLVGTRIAQRLGVDDDSARQAYYGCLLFYVGCTADAEIAADLFAEGALLSHFTPVAFASPGQTLVGVMRALAAVDGGRLTRSYRAVSRLPRAARGHRSHIAAFCEVAQMLTNRVGLPNDVSAMSATFTERWDGRGEPSHLRGEQIPLGARIAQVARDATFHHALGGREHAIVTMQQRAGRAFDPAIVEVVSDAADELFELDPATSAWDEVLACEPGPALTLAGDEIDRCLSAMADFADLLSPYLAGHSSGVAVLAAEAARVCGLPEQVVVEARRAAYVHDLGRVSVGAQVWQKPGPLTPDERERVRLHPYYTDRVLDRAPFLSALASVATSHHERLDGTGYHRGLPAPSLSPVARLVAAADVYQAMTSPRPYREALSPARAAEELRAEVSTGRLDAECVSAVLSAAGQAAPRLARPSGLTDREAQVVGLLAHGLPTKQIARALGISAKTADRHIQNAYAKIGVSSRAAAALFAMEHGLAAWGELRMVAPVDRS